MRAYVDGKEINEIPEFAEICKMDDWLQGLLDWIKVNRPETRIDMILSGNVPNLKDARLLEVWIGGAPKTRAMEIGGIVRRIKVTYERGG